MNFSCEDWGEEKKNEGQFCKAHFTMLAEWGAGENARRSGLRLL